MSKKQQHITASYLRETMKGASAVTRCETFSVGATIGEMIVRVTTESSFSTIAF